jgi:hypothetical protein
MRFGWLLTMIFRRFKRKLRGGKPPLASIILK